jgi:hypothetical protein
MRMRQDAMLAAARDSRPIDLDDYRSDLKQQLAQAIEQDRMSPVPLGQDQIMRAYASLLGPSMANQIVQQFMNSSQRDLQKSMSEGDDAQLMRPMIASVMQLDR